MNKIYAYSEFFDNIQKYFNSSKNTSKYTEATIKIIIDTYLRKAITRKPNEMKDINETRKQGDTDVYKCYIGPGGERFRLYFCYGKDIIIKENKWEINDYDILLLHLGLPYEHDDWAKIANHFNQLIKSGNILEKDKKEYNCSSIYKVEVESTNQSSYMRKSPIIILTDEQISLFENIKINPPALIAGAAGTGKTVLSVKAYEEYQNKNVDNILYLTFSEDLRLDVEYKLKDNGKVAKPNCKTFKSLALEELNLRESNYADEDTFKTWFNDYVKPHKSPQQSNFIHKILKTYSSNIISNMIYTFFRTYGWNFDNYFSFHNINRENFKRKLKKENLSDEIPPDEIFNICQNYEEYLKNNNQYTDNDLAVRIIDKNKPHYDAIIVDEVQDLTIPQIKAMYTLLKPEHKSRFVLFGDDNQTINPSLLTLRDVQTTINELYNRKIVDKISPLTESHRTSIEVIEYINYLSKVRVKVIGKNKAPLEVELTSNMDNSECKRPAIVFNKNIINELFSNPNTFGPKTKIITPDLNVIEDYKKNTNWIIQKHNDRLNNICTLEESKGREWDTVILYNFISHDLDTWTNYSNYITNENLQKKRNTFERMNFNRYYVALTRARKNVIIVENENISDDIKNVFFEQHNKIERPGSVLYNFKLKTITKNSSLDLYFEKSASPEKWHEFAKEAFAINDFKEASENEFNALNTLPDDLKGTDIENEYRENLKLYDTYRDFYYKDKIIDDTNYDKYLNCFLNNNDIERRNELFNRYNPDNKNKKIDLYDFDVNENTYNQFLKIYSVYKKDLHSSDIDQLAVKIIKAYKLKINKIMED